MNDDSRGVTMIRRTCATHSQRKTATALVVSLLLALSACASSTTQGTSPVSSAAQGARTPEPSPPPATSGTPIAPVSSSIPRLDLTAAGSWKIACVLSPAEVNSILAPAGIKVDSAQPASSTDNAACDYSSADSAGAASFQVAAYDPTQMYGYLTPGVPANEWTAPNPAQGYQNACNAAQANGGAQCIPDIGRGLIVGDKYNQAVLFVDGPAFYDLNIEYFAGGIAAAATYIALAKSVAAAGPVK
jgi:hypothetical protein